MTPKPSLRQFGGFFDIPGKLRRLEELDRKIASSPNFWDNPQLSAPILKEKKVLELAVGRITKLEGLNADLATALEFAKGGDDSFLAEGEAIITPMDAELRAMEVQSLLGGELDLNDAVLTINAGAGGTESCDWAQMLLRMYLRCAERHGWTAEILDSLAGEGAGIKSATVQLTGPYAYGLMKSEIGVHRLVRISPFDSNARRHTSFASVYVSAMIDDTIKIEIEDKDLRIDTYRASGAGGQHVNKTESAVRITHMPTGVVVACQNQRSQHQNRDFAMKLLRSALYERELAARREKQQALEGTKSDNSFGHQIRSYVLHPYKLVKDHRTDHESREPDAVLDGDLDGFINEYLISTLKK